MSLDNSVLFLHVLPVVVHPVTPAEEPDDVPDVTVSEGRAEDSRPRGVEMFVPVDVQPLVGCHAEVRDLVEVAGEEDNAPAQCQQLEAGQQEDGGVTHGDGGDTGEAAVGGTLALAL